MQAWTAWTPPVAACYSLTKVVPKNFGKFTRKYLCQVSFLIELQVGGEFCGTYKNTYCRAPPNNCFTNYSLGYWNQRNFTEISSSFFFFIKALEHEYIFSKYSWNLFKNIILPIFRSVALNYLNNCLHISVFIYVCF